MSTPAAIMILAGICLIPTLVAGAISDIRTRTFPAKYWEWTAKIAGILTFICYLVLISNGDLGWVVMLGTISILCAAFCYYMGLNFGSGGDWRAMMYISLICPMLVIQTGIFSLIIGAILAVYMMTRPDPAGVLDVTPMPFKSVPFAVAILAGFVLAILANIAFGF